VVFDPCSNESVQVNGTLIMFFEPFSDESGRSHVIAHRSFHGTGVGLSSGAIYVSNEVSNLTDTVSESLDQFSFSVIATELLVGKGDATDRLFHFTMHRTFADDEFKVLLTDIRLECHF
jgi:hypothetical protein